MLYDKKGQKKSRLTEYRIAEAAIGSGQTAFRIFLSQNEGRSLVFVPERLFLRNTAHSRQLPDEMTFPDQFYTC